MLLMKKENIQNTEINVNKEIITTNISTELAQEVNETVSTTQIEKNINVVQNNNSDSTNIITEKK